MALLIPEVFILLLTDAVFLLLLLYVSPSAYKIARRWDISSPSGLQYELDRKRHLIFASVRTAFIFKLPLFLFFIYTSDKLSGVLTGAMCAAGTINATIYGQELLYVKIFNIFLMSAWLTVHSCTLSSETLPHTRKAAGFLLVITVSSAVETLLLFLNFQAIDPSAVVSCCSSIYSPSEPSFLMSVSPFTAFFIFLGSAALYLTSVLLKNTAGTAFFSILFFFAGVLNLILFTGTYIYELPSHRCPYCILQKEYGYIGYLFYISLFAGTSAGISGFIRRRLSGIFPFKTIMISLICMLVFLFFSIYFPLKYFLTNNVWL